MNEKLLLGNANTYDLAVNGVRVTSKEKLDLSLIVPIGKTLEEIQLEFSQPDNTKVLKTVHDTATRAIFEGYVHLGSQCMLDTDAKIKTEIIPAETDEEGNLIKEEQIVVLRGTVAYITLEKENLETKVAENRADIDYVMMMGGI